MLSLNTYKFNNVAFGRAIKKEEEAEFADTLKRAQKLNGNDGHMIFIVPDSCLPQSKATNTGVSNLSNQEASKFFDFAKKYFGINVIETLPQGQLHYHDGHYISYMSTALSLGIPQVNLELLTTPEFDSLLDKKDIQKVVDSNNAVDKETIANFDNVMLFDSSQDKALKKAFNNFKDKNLPLKEKMDDFVSKNKDWLEPKGIYEILAKKHNKRDFRFWDSEVDKNLYNSEFDINKRGERLAEILSDSNNKNEIEFYNFKQFLAEEHLKIGKENLNKKGIKLFGDCLINASKEEQWAYPKAFNKETTLGWGVPSYNFHLLNDKNSDIYKFFTKKIELHAKRYDGIRFDVGWAYITPKTIFKNGTIQKTDYGNTVTDFIKSTIKNVKKENFDEKNLIWEVEADGSDFAIFENSNTIKSSLKKVTNIYSTAYMSEDWGNYDNFIKRGFDRENLVIGVGNHDHIPLRQLAEVFDPFNHEDIKELRHLKEQQIYPLAKSLNLDAKKLSANPIEFIKAKFADALKAKNNMVFYMDAFGRNERFDSHNFNTKENYKYKIPENFEDAYHKSLQEGFALNIMDAYEKVLKAKNLDKKDPELYQKIIKFRDILYSKEETIQKTLKKNKSTKIFLGITAAITGIGTLAWIAIKNKKNK